MSVSQMRNWCIARTTTEFVFLPPSCPTLQQTECSLAWRAVLDRAVGWPVTRVPNSPGPAACRQRPWGGSGSSRPRAPCATCGLSSPPHDPARQTCQSAGPAFHKKCLAVLQTVLACLEAVSSAMDAVPAEQHALASCDKMQIPGAAQLTNWQLFGAAQPTKLQPSRTAQLTSPGSGRCWLMPGQSSARCNHSISNAPGWLWRTSGFSGSFISLARRSRLARSGALSGRYSSIRFWTIRPAHQQHLPIH